MLSLGLRPGKAIMIGDNISIRLVSNEGNKVTLELEGPEELKAAIRRQLGFDARIPRAVSPQEAAPRN